MSTSHLEVPSALPEEIHDIWSDIVKPVINQYILVLDPAEAMYSPPGKRSFDGIPITIWDELRQQVDEQIKRRKTTASEIGPRLLQFYVGYTDRTLRHLWPHEAAPEQAQTAAITYWHEAVCGITETLLVEASPERFRRWQRQAFTPFKALTPAEQEQDAKEAQKLVKIIEDAL